jgi:hypothetical protein
LTTLNELIEKHLANSKRDFVAIQPKRAKTLVKHPNNVHTKLTDPEAIRTMYESGMNIAELAQHFGVVWKTMSAAMRRFHIKKRVKPAMPPRNKHSFHRNALPLTTDILNTERPPEPEVPLVFEVTSGRCVGDKGCPFPGTKDHLCVQHFRDAHLDRSLLSSIHGVLQEFAPF